eukprot:658992-Pelagomonas_calceolata.AAC.3
MGAKAKKKQRARHGYSQSSSSLTADDCGGGVDREYHGAAAFLANKALTAMERHGLYGVGLFMSMDLFRRLSNGENRAFIHLPSSFAECRFIEPEGAQASEGCMLQVLPGRHMLTSCSQLSLPVCVDFHSYLSMNSLADAASGPSRLLPDHHEEDSPVDAGKRPMYQRGASPPPGKQYTHTCTVQLSLPSLHRFLFFLQ